MKILIVDDEVTTTSYLRKGLTEEGFAVDVSKDAEEAENAISIYEYDIILLDVMLPKVNGFELCHEWRERRINTPILFLTARDDVADRVHGLNSGGDDYLVKPFAFEELLARIRAILRRRTNSSLGAIIQIADLTIDTERRQVQRQGKQIQLTAREYQLLEYLSYNCGKIVTRTTLWEHVWESGSEPDSNVVDVYIRYLRNKLGRNPNLISTVRGVGYMMTIPGGETSSEL